MNDPSYILDADHPANKGKTNKYPAESAEADRHRDEVLRKDTSAYRGRIAGPAAPDVPREEFTPQTETDRLFPDRERVARKQARLAEE